MRYAVYTPPTTTLSWQMRSLYAERRNANVQLIVRSFTFRVSELLSLSLFKRDGIWASIELGIKPFREKIVEMPGARHVSKISLLGCSKPKLILS